MSIQDEVAKRYGWMDYDHFKLNTDDTSDVWCYRAVVDVVKLEKENAALVKLVKAAYIEGVNVADPDFNDRQFVHRDTHKTKEEFWSKSKALKKLEGDK